MTVIPQKGYYNCDCLFIFSVYDPIFCETKLALIQSTL
jgi:hypothetical protein